MLSGARPHNKSTHKPTLYHSLLLHIIKIMLGSYFYLEQQNRCM